MGLDLDQVKGSGPQGRIVKEDVLNAARAGSSAKVSESPGTDEMPALSSVNSRGDRVIPFSRMRQTIADRLTRSYQTIPHFYLTMKADVSEFMAWREQFLDRSGHRISVNALAVKAAAVALQRFPRMNSHVSPDSLTLCRNVSIGIAVSLEEGLIVPVIHEAPDLELDEIAAERLGILKHTANLTPWRRVVDTFNNAERTVRIALVGKYVELNDTYKSIHEALVHGGIANSVRTEIVYIDSEALEKEDGIESKFTGIDGILIPGGFGQRGIEGMIQTASVARRGKIPYLGICLGMQIMVIEYARSIMGFEEANSTEFSPDSPHPVISLLEEQVDVTAYGGTMRLGRNDTKLLENTRIRSSYGTELISERHRHRYEVSNKFRNSLQEAGLIVSGLTPDDALVESVEWNDHPWGVGVQFHPEFKSRPTAAHPLFVSFIQAALERGDISN